MTLPSQRHEQGKRAVDEMSSPTGSRRKFITWVIGAVATVIGAGLLIPLAGYLVSPALKRRESSWIDVGPVEDLRQREPVELEYVSTMKDGWRTTSTKKAVWAVKKPGGNIVVFSPICPHLGCGYRWDFEDRKFKCPCHGSVYDVTGKVIGGPAPRPLDALPSKVENGKLFVIYKQFKSGLDHSVEL